MNAFKVGYVYIHLSNIDYINDGDGTSYSPPVIYLKSGKRIPIEGDYSGYAKLIEAWKAYEGGSGEE